MKISEAWQKGKMIDGYPFIEASVDHPILFINHRKIRDDHSRSVGHIKKLNDLDFDLLSDRISRRDFNIVKAFKPDDDPTEWEIFSLTDDDSGLHPFRLAGGCIADTIIGLSRYTLKLAVYSRKKIRDVSQPLQDGEDLMLDWQIVAKEINFP